MRASSIVLLILSLTLPSIASSQSKITIKMQDATLDEMIRNVRSKTSYRFLYHVEELSKYGKKSVDVRDVSIHEFLNDLLKETKLTYDVEDDVIIIRAKNPQEQTKEKRVIHGKVLDDRDAPLPGATVALKGTQMGLVSDKDGKFRIELPDQKNLILQISFLGMETREITLSDDKKGDEKELIIRLTPELKQVDEVVVTGYANIRKNSFTGNSVTITRDELMSVSKSSVINALQVFDPSFRVQTNNEWGSDPNALPEMYIRGRSGIGVKELDKGELTKSALKDNPNLPTFIMDGFEISVQKLYDMDMNRIESITILKDAAATALYGSRAANGVVVITTVAPKPGRLNVSYSVTGEVTMPDLRDYNLMNAEEKLETERLAGALVREDADDQLKAEIEYNEKLFNVKKGVNTYWLSKPLRTVLNHKHSLMLDGGANDLRFGVEFSYNNQDGVMKGSFRDRIGGGLYIDYRIGKFQVRDQVTFNVTQIKESPYGNFSDYTRALPYDEYLDENGRLLKKLRKWMDVSNVLNPLYESTLENFEKSSIEELINNFSLVCFLTDHLQAKVLFSLTRQTERGKRFYDPLSEKNETPVASYNPVSGELNITDESLFSWDMTASVSYNRSIHDHNINFQALVNSRSRKSKSTSAIYRGFPSGYLNSPNYAKEIYEKPSTSENTSRLIGFLATLNYSWRDIYLMDGSVRFDGSSEFGEDRRYAPFWSVGAGINIHKYAFMKNQNVIDLLKIRGSFGQTGKVNFPPYVARTTYQILFDDWYKQGFGATLAALGNKKLTWETTNKTDIGLEVSLWRQALYLKGSYYNEKTIDLINTVTIASSTGFNTYMDNIGEVKNTGFELDVRSVVYKDKNTYVSVFGNLGRNKNKILKISESLKAYNDQVDAHFSGGNSYDQTQSRPFTKYVEGGSLTSIFGVQSMGIDPASGEEIFLNIDGTQTKTWRANQQVVLGNTEPDASGAFGVNATYKNFSLYMTFMYEFGGQQYNQTLVDKVENARIFSQNVDKRVLSERWKEPGDKTKFKKLNPVGKSIETTRPTSRFVQNNNVLTFNSLTVGYDLPSSMTWMKSIGLSMLRFEIGANDLARWSSIKAERGLSYPYAHTINFSLKASF